MPIIGAFMVPHPPIILPEVGRGDEQQIVVTTKAFQTVAEYIRELAPDTILVLSPHSIMYADYFHISPGSEASGSMKEFRAPQVKFHGIYDERLVSTIVKVAREHGFPAGTQGEQSNLLDHGTMVPLYFINHEYKKYKLVRIGLSGLSFIEHYRFGQIIQKAVDRVSEKVVIIGSGDLSHKCRAEGPYGFDPAGPLYDERIMETMGSGSFGELLAYDEAFCEQAAECGHRSFCIMAGCLDGYDVEAETLSHEDTFGVGYGVCSYQILGKDAERCFLKKKEATELETAAARAERADAYVRLAILSFTSYIRDGKKLQFQKRNGTIEGDRFYFCEDVLRQQFPSGVPRAMIEQAAGVFVSIHMHGQLRGCIGTIVPVTGCIAEEILRNAISASTEDPRFAPITPQELPYLTVSVDVLGEIEPVESPDELDVKRYGVIVTKGYKRGLLLPNLPGVNTVAEQVDIAIRKAGIQNRNDIKLERFEVIRHE